MRAVGKHSLTQADMLYLAHWARKLSQKEALSFGTTWDQVCRAVPATTHGDQVFDDRVGTVRHRARYGRFLG